MGVCLAVTKVIGTTTLGIYTGIITSNITNYDILIHVLQSTSISNFNEFNSNLKAKLQKNSILLGLLGGVSSLAFQLSYFKAPLRSKHPYLIYASLVLPLSSIIYGILTRGELIKYFKLDEVINSFKNNEDGNTVKKVKENVRSELDNSVYKDLGDDSSSNEGGQQEDDEISKEVEIQLNKTSLEQLLGKLNLANKIVGGVSFIGFVIASVGIYGDF